MSSQMIPTMSALLSLVLPTLPSVLISYARKPSLPGSVTPPVAYFQEGKCRAGYHREQPSLALFVRSGIVNCVSHRVR
eukprot:3669125-Heterocapsa_arctica.AAC.1